MAEGSSTLLPPDLSQPMQSAENASSNVADVAFNKTVRLVTLYVIALLGLVGGLLVCAWLFHNRRRKSRVNALILHVALSDLSVICFASVLQIVWEHLDRNWYAGDVGCRLLKWMQGFVLMASNNLLVVLSVDRHQAIRAPLRQPFPVWKMALVGWGCAALFSAPQLYVFRQNHLDNPDSPFHNKTLCESIFRVVPRSHRQAYLTYVGLMTFYLPLILISICYVRIFLKIAEKATQGNRESKVGKLQLRSTTNSSLPKAKVKTLKMTVVIVTAFVVFSAPYHILEMIYSFGDHMNVSKDVAAILGSLAVANSAINPYVFLLFNASWTCVRGVFCTKRTGYQDTFHSTRTESPHTTQTDVKYSCSHSQHPLRTDHVDMHEMKAKKTNADYVLVSSQNGAVAD